MDFADEIYALDENFHQFYYEYQRDWLDRSEINFQAIKSLWDLLNNIYDNLDDIGVAIPAMKEVLAVVEKMNDIASEVQSRGEATQDGIVFSGTRDEYGIYGGSLLERLYELEVHTNDAREQLIQMGKSRL